MVYIALLILGSLLIVYFMVVKQANEALLQFRVKRHRAFRHYQDIAQRPIQIPNVERFEFEPLQMEERISLKSVRDMIGDDANRQTQFLVSRVDVMKQKICRHLMGDERYFRIEKKENPLYPEEIGFRVRLFVAPHNHQK